MSRESSPGKVTIATLDNVIVQSNLSGSLTRPEQYRLSRLCQEKIEDLEEVQGVFYRMTSYFAQSSCCKSCHKPRPLNWTDGHILDLFERRNPQQSEA